MPIKKLQYITSGETESDILEEVSEFLDVGGKWVQLRIKNRDLDTLDIANQIKNKCDKRAIFIVNDDVVLSKKCDADGVHLGLDDMPIGQARHILGRGKIIGGTANTYQECLIRQQEGANYIGLGPFAFTKTKCNLSPILRISGYVEILKNRDIKIPVIAVGGIILEDIIKLKNIVFGVACSGLIKNSKDKKQLIKEINSIFK